MLFTEEYILHTLDTGYVVGFNGTISACFRRKVRLRIRLVLKSRQSSTPTAIIVPVINRTNAAAIINTGSHHVW